MESAAEKAERNKIIKKLLKKLVTKHETAEKAKLLLLKNPQIKIQVPSGLKAG
jgi:hypothetical protein